MVIFCTYVSLPEGKKRRRCEFMDTKLKNLKIYPWGKKISDNLPHENDEWTPFDQAKIVVTRFTETLMKGIL